MTFRTKAARGAEFEVDGFFVLRTPLLPLDELAAWSAGLVATTVPAELSAELEDALAHDRALLRERLRVIARRPEVREALFVASPSLYQSVGAWLDSPESPRGSAAEGPLVRYFVRMCARTTPFGLFAGHSLGRLADRSELRLAPRAAYGRHTRFDNEFIGAVVEGLLLDPEVRERAPFVANDTAYRVGTRLRYVETRRGERAHTYVLSAVDAIDAVDAALSATRTGARLSEVARAIAATDPEISEDDARAFADELCEAGLLVPAISPTLTGPEPIHTLLEELRGVAEGPRRVLASAQAELASLDRGGVGAPPSVYRAIAEQLESVHDEVDRARLFQVDLSKPGETLSLGPELATELTRAVKLLVRMGHAEHDAVLEHFARAFTERFGEEEIPLLEALDPEYGVGLGERSPEDASSLLAGVETPSSLTPTASWSARERVLLGLLTDARAAGRTRIELDEATCRALETTKRLPLPSSFSVLGYLYAASTEALANGAFEFEVEGLNGPSGARLLGRFCHGDPALTERVRVHLQAEERTAPEAVFAEVVHVPDARLGNVLVRPVLRAHEIPILARSGADSDHLIGLADLRVTVRGGRIVLRSSRLGREILPRLTSAHGYAAPTNLHAYRFLCALAGQGNASVLCWSWGALSTAAFLPRVSHGRLILSAARWLVSTSEPVAFRKLEPGTSEAFVAVQRLRRLYGLPRHVAIGDTDQVLPIDLDNVLSVDAFVQAARTNPRLAIVEQLGVYEGATVGPEGRYRSQLLVPFVRRPDVEVAALPTAKAPASPPVSAMTRRFLPGSEWLFVELYAGTSTIDQVLLALAPLLDDLASRSAIDRWFFVRYSDPAWHLRLRLHGAPRQLWSMVFGELSTMIQRLQEARLVHRVSYDTYVREIERYGGPAGMEVCERLFHVDSVAVLRALETLTADAGAELRWRAALCSVDALLAALGLDDVSRCALAQTLRGGFRVELGDAGLDSWIGSRYRRERLAFEALISQEVAEDSPLAAPVAALLHARPALEALGLELRALARGQRLDCSFEEVCGSLVHMHLNRLLRGDHRRQEAVLYDFLARLYDGRIQRARASSRERAGAT